MLLWSGVCAIRGSRSSETTGDGAWTSSSSSRFSGSFSTGFDGLG